MYLDTLSDNLYRCSQLSFAAMGEVVDLSWHIAAAGAIVGFVVGLTGMGGGALMTPILVIFFHVQPLAAVSSDLVASLIMKPVGAGGHWRGENRENPPRGGVGFGAGA